MRRENSKSSRLWQMSFAAIAVFIMVVSMVFFVWSLYLERPYLTYKNLPFPTLFAHVRAGQVVPVRIVRCNSHTESHNYETSHAAWNIEENTSYLIGSHRLPLDPGCTDVVSLVNKLPDNIPPGKYFLYGTAEVPRRLIGKHYVDWRSEQFEVIK